MIRYSVSLPAETATNPEKTTRFDRIENFIG
jgi:hypothetical protein